jgi:hypothetical protein
MVRGRSHEITYTRFHPVVPSRCGLERGVQPHSKKIRPQMVQGLLPGVQSLSQASKRHL